MWPNHKPWIGSLTALVFALAGCLDVPTAKDSSTPPEAAADAWHSFPPIEHDLMIRYFVMSTAVPVYVPAPGNEGSWVAKVPEGADNVTLNATWTPSTPLATIQHCMVHTADGDKPGPMVAERKGTSPLGVPRSTFPNSTRAVVVMCMPMNEPLAAEVMQMIHVTVEFTKGVRA